MDNKRIYRIVFHNQGKIYEVHARHVGQGNLYGFVEIGELMFGERSAVLVDPSEERLKAEFQGVRVTYVPLHAIIRIDEVEKEGANKISSDEATSNVTPFPMPFYPPRGGPSSS